MPKGRTRDKECLDPPGIRLCKMPEKVFLLRITGPLPILLGYIYLALQPDLRTAVPVLILLTAGQSIVLAVLVFLAHQGRLRFTTLEICVWAALFRLIFLPTLPTLSDDLYRYAWDGAIVSEGGNPYLLPPSAFAGRTTGQMAEILSKINHPHLVTIYPPLAQFLFGISWAVSGCLTGIKGMLIVMDLLTCLMLARLAPLREAAILYAWHPLAVLECASSGHLEPVCLMFVILALFLFKRKKFSSGMALGASVMIKLLPLIFLPFFVRRTGNRERLLFLAGMILICAVFLLPFFGQLGNLFKTLSIYGMKWEFSGFLYGLLKPVAGTQWARLWLGVIFPGLAALIWQRDFSIERSLYLLSLAFILVTPILHPWYALFFLVFLPLYPRPLGLVFAWAAFLPYYVLINYGLSGVWKEDFMLTSVVFLTAAAAFAAGMFSGMDPKGI